MKVLAYIGIVLCVSAYIVFMIMYPHSTKCSTCGLCISIFPNTYYWAASCAGTMFLAIVLNKIWEDKIFQYATLWFASVVLIDFVDRRFNFIDAGAYYPVRLIAYTTALCIGLLLLRYF